MELSEIGQEKSPVMRQEMPKGLRPFDWVYRCFRLATCLNTTSQNQFSHIPIFPYLVMYSKVTGSSTVSLWD